MVSKIVGLAAGAMLFASTAAVAQAPVASLSVVRAGAVLSDESSLQEEGGISTGAIVGVTFALIAVGVAVASDDGESGGDDDDSESP